MQPVEACYHSVADRNGSRALTSPARHTAFVTGAATGLGYVIACSLARAGYDLAVSSHEVGRLSELLCDPAVQNRKVIPVQLDLRVEADINIGFDTAVDVFGDIYVLVNNAGRALVKPAVDVAWADWDDVVAINLRGAYFMSQKFAAHCIARNRPGCIVNIASTHGLTGFADRSVYGIAKGGLIQMTRMLAIEWAGHNIRVNAIAPSTALTPSRQKMHDPQTLERMLARIPLGRFITPEEVAAAVCYLASADAASITGQTLALDGGLTAG
jgi:NAD(P)-dependent dehydrogenase (short-subunit alcohol dehydrogenase family)